MGHQMKLELVGLIVKFAHHYTIQGVHSSPWSTIRFDTMKFVEEWVIMCEGLLDWVPGLQIEPLLEGVA